jgi:hypothetical protein
MSAAREWPSGLGHLTVGRLAQVPSADKQTASKKILDEYDPSRTGFLSKEAFMALADVIMKSYELRSADMVPPPPSFLLVTE